MKIASASLCAALIVCGQPAPREFDAVSIKPYVPKGPISEACNSRGDPVMLTRTGCTLQQLVQQVYDVKDYQVHVKAPSWVETDRYVIQARLAAPAPEPEMMNMLQPVLAARFHLTVHWETREAPAYLLQVAPRGLKLSPATSTKQCGSVFVREGIVKADCVTIDDIAEVLEQFVFSDRPVFNQTSVSKEKQYQIKLEFGTTDDSAGGPSIFVALPDQAGLVLKAGKAPLKMIVIDQAQRPDAN